MEKNRLEAFSDGVLAIIITIMVLELHVPHTPDWFALVELWPVFFAYLLSFAFIGIYWGNHHHLIHTVKKVNPGIMWTNLHLLFWLSLVPFATAWMGENHFAANTVAAYAVLLALCGIAFNILGRCIAASQDHDEALQLALKKLKLKGTGSLIAYFSAIPLAFVDTRISMFLFFAVAVAWLVPDRNIFKAIGE